MVGKRHPPEEIAAKLEQADEMVAKGKKHREITRALGVSLMTYHRWRKLRNAQFSGAVAAPAVGAYVAPNRKAEEMPKSRLEEVQLENTRLRRLVTDLLLEKLKLEEELRERQDARYQLNR